MRLAVFATHPIQYQVPIWRELARTPGLDVVVHYFSDRSVRGEVDPGFGVAVAWDTPLLEGYESIFLSRDADIDSPRTVSLPDARAVLVEGRFDAVYVNGYIHRFERQVVLAARRLGLRAVMRAEFTDVPRPGHTRWRRLLRNLYLHWFYSHVDAFCYVGETGLRHLQARRIPPERTFFSPYCVDTTLFLDQTERYDRLQERRRLCIPDDVFVFLFSGKLIPRKAPLLLLEALGRMKSRDRLVLIVLGDGVLRDEFLAKGRSLLGDKLLFQGFVNQSDLGGYYAAADAFVLPSRYETWGLVVNEAMHFGLPVVVSDHVGSHADLVMPGETGFVFPVDDADGLARALERLSSDPEGAHRMGRQARERASTYTVENATGGIRKALGLAS